MVRHSGVLNINNPWPKFAWGITAAFIVVTTALGFGVLSRFQQNAPELDLWNAICRGLGITSDTAPATEKQPALYAPTRVAWTRATLDQIEAGDPEHGAFIALNCTACHGPGGYKIGVPALQEQHAAYIERQLGEFAQDIRQNDILQQMRVIAKQLTPEEMNALATYYGKPPQSAPGLVVGSR